MVDSRRGTTTVCTKPCTWALHPYKDARREILTSANHTFYPILRHLRTRFLGRYLLDKPSIEYLFDGIIRIEKSLPSLAFEHGLNFILVNFIKSIVTRTCKGRKWMDKKKAAINLFQVVFIRQWFRVLIGNNAPLP